MENPNGYQEEEKGIFQTGDTRPPKKHSTLVNILLIVIIFLCGIVSAMGVLNISLMRKVQEPAEETGPLIFSASTMPTEASPTTGPAESIPSRNDVKLDIRTSPDSMPNVPQEGGMSLQNIYQKTIPSVVSIRADTNEGTFTGTGVVLTQDGYIVTNSHVIEGAHEIQVVFTDQKIMDASLVGRDVISDLAVLYVKANHLIPAEFGNSDNIQVGDLAVAIGDPLGLTLRGTMTDGIISAINRDITTGGKTMTLLQTNAALNSGNSGGPLINCYGQVIGINTMKIGDYVNSAGVEGLGFAIPSTTVKEVVDQLIGQGYVTGRPDLGFIGKEISVLYQKLYRLPEGIFIAEVKPDSDAYKKGIRSGDVLLALDGIRVPTGDILNSILYEHKAGDTVEVVIFRSNTTHKISLTIGQADQKK